MVMHSTGNVALFIYKEHLHIALDKARASLIWPILITADCRPAIVPLAQKCFRFHCIFTSGVHLYLYCMFQRTSPR